MRTPPALAFADHRRNHNLGTDNRAALVLMDYAGRARLKVYVHVTAVPLDADPVLAELVADPEAVRPYCANGIAVDQKSGPETIAPRLCWVQIV